MKSSGAAGPGADSLNRQWQGSVWQEALPAGLEVLATQDIQAYSGACGRALLHEPFTAACAALLRTQDVQLHHTKAFLKPPRRGAFL